jgi:histidinol phosphatase-like enzyme
MHTQPATVARTPAVFVDLDTVLLAVHQGRRGPELGLQADLEDALQRLSEVAHPVVVLVDPAPGEVRRELGTKERLDAVLEGLGKVAEGLVIVVCPHGDGAACDCAKPNSGLIDIAVAKHGLSQREGWYIGADQEGVVCGRNSGLRTIRIGPTGEDHLSHVHRPDYEARDLMDAANHIWVEELAA